MNRSCQALTRWICPHSVAKGQRIDISRGLHGKGGAMARTVRSMTAASAVLLAALVFAPPASAAPPTDVPPGTCAGQPWMDPHKSPDERAAALLPQLTLDEKVQLMHTVSD